ncbi:GGDEF domain-containing phosphodiesterase [Pseudoduganella namucuonensis]|uniref:Diguanylate cyclase (GGDEF) domain-containing protein n=1 Tax=Pseudoduganella namucuonensis TaxID=1035707 RepID=A0A1I7HAV5_9BURK|nr:GGDEF domain-containing phosphodiesterase [Pseudoduganella namucuonensis]SFU57861.1 diguanylate cyclase (GGDEF) domain-containing protein [Pseudoduganella namucuonensis]
MRIHFDRLSLRAKLALGFGAITCLICLGSIAVTGGGGQGASAVERYFESDARVADLGADSVAAMERARRYEKEFLLHARAAGREETAAAAAAQVAAQLETVRRHMASIRQLGGDPRNAETARAIETSTRLFEHSFMRVAHLHRRLASLSAGSPERRKALAEMQGSSNDYQTAADDIDAGLQQMRAHSGQALEHARTAARGAGAWPVWALAAAWGLSMLLALFLARLVMRGVKGVVDEGVRFAGRLAARDWSARVSVPRGRDEFAALATALNDMAGEMQGAHERELKRTAELERANRGLRVLFRCNEALVRASSEPQLLDAICRHLVEEGGYSFAWVGLPCQDELGTIRPAATAGDAALRGKLRFHCGSDTGQRGLAGNAIVREQQVLARAQYGMPAELGYTCGLALPLLHRGEALGALTLYSNDAAAFDGADIKLLRDLADDLAHGVAAMRDTVRRRLAEQAQDHQSRHDAVTCLPNRALFNERLQQATVHAARAGRRVAVLVLGLDRYREVRNRLGQEAGNALLKHVAGAMQSTLRGCDTVARLQGDEFAVVVSGLAATEDAMVVAAKLLAAAQKPLVVAEGVVSTTASVGISVHMCDGADPASLLCCANAAMVSAQAMGGNRMRYYAPEMNERASQLLALEADLRRGIENREMCVYYQPRAVLATGEIASAEALLRWRHPVRGMMAPAEFLPLAESSGLIVPLGVWVLREVCRQQRAWIDAGRAPAVVAVKLSPRQFREEGLATEIRQALSDYRLEPGRIELEITEATVMDKLDDAIARLRALQDIGVRLSLDDFGVGHSSLSRLRDLPVDSLKLDQSFVRNLTTDPADAAICQSIIDMAHHLHLTVIAEGVETQADAEHLRRAGCDEMQGHYLAHPQPAKEFARMLDRRGAPAVLCS